jgi:hypothetical protein
MQQQSNPECFRGPSERGRLGSGHSLRVLPRKSLIGGHPELAHIELSEKEAKERGCLSVVQGSDGSGHARDHGVRNTRIPESTGCGGGRSDSWIHRVRRRRGRNLVFRANCNASRPAVCRAARRDTSSLDPRRGTYPTILLRTFATQGCGNNTSLNGVPTDDSRIELYLGERAEIGTAMGLPCTLNPPGDARAALFRSR